MDAVHAKLIDTKGIWEKAKTGFVVGWLARLDDDGKVWVDFPGNDSGPLPARLTSAALIDFKQGSISSKAPLVILFENENQRLPIIIGVIHDQLVRSVG